MNETLSHGKRSNEGENLKSAFYGNSQMSRVQFGFATIQTSSIVQLCEECCCKLFRTF